MQRRLCRFWRVGLCTKGPECAFSHESEPVTRAYIACPVHAASPGSCPKGDGPAGCPLSHDPATRTPCESLAFGTR